MQRCGRVFCVVSAVLLGGCGGSNWWMAGSVGNKPPSSTSTSPLRQGSHQSWSDENAAIRPALGAPVAGKAK